MGCKDLLMRFVVLGSLVTAVVFGVWVAIDCRYLEPANASVDLEVGIFRYSMDQEGDEYDTSGECITYGSKANDGYARTAQVCAALAPAFGLLIFFLTSFNQFCCPIPCSGILVSISYFGAQVCTALIWLILRSDVCALFSCEWGRAASGNVIAQIMYFVAAIFHKCLPSPKEIAANRRAEAAEKKAAEAEARQKEAEEKAQAAEDRPNTGDAEMMAQTY
jgi:hypothetical protein